MEIKLGLLLIEFIRRDTYIVCTSSRPAKSPGISGSLQKSGVISRSPGMVKKTPGIEGI